MTQPRVQVQVDSIDVARERLASHAKRVEMNDLPDGVQVTIKTDPRGTLKLAAMMVGGGLSAGALLLIVYLTRDNPVPRDFIISKPIALLGLMAVFGTVLGLSIGAASFANGPDRPTVLQLRPGTVRIERWMAGDHVLRDYSAADIKALLINVALDVQTRTDQFSLAPSIPHDTQVALGELMALMLWGQPVRYDRPSPLPGTGREIVIAAPQAHATSAGHAVP